jgi:hypothetical protein
MSTSAPEHRLPVQQPTSFLGQGDTGSASANGVTDGTGSRADSLRIAPPVGRFLLLCAFAMCIALSAPLAAAPSESDSATATAPEPVFKGGLFDLYALNRVTDVPNYITADLLLAAHAMLEQQSLRRLEIREMKPALTRLLDRLSQRLADSESAALPKATS